jgi:hypothetical protein
MKYNLNKKRFRGVSNNSNGEVSSSTLFTYHQEGDVIWGSYEGGVIVRGSLIGKVTEDDIIEFNYTHINQDKTLLSGFCRSTIELLDTGKLRLHEQWTWTTGKEGQGESIVEEV